MLTLVHCDIFDQDAHAIVNTVNCVGVMGKGLALQFKKRYPHMYRAYYEACREGRVSLGAVWPYQLDAIHWVINFPTKGHWRNPSRLEYIQNGLFSLANFIVRFDIPSIAIPALGCQNGGLALVDVQPLIEAFADGLPTIDVRLVLAG